jgi:outer membrane protein assembly factor BamB
VFTYTASHAQQKAAVKMFRNNPAHNSLVLTAGDFIYDTKAWSFFASAPVRSSVMVDGNRLFFGNALGNFFAVNKTTGKLIWQYNTGFPINSSAASQNGKVFFSDNKQTIYALNETNGQLVWKFDLKNKQPYPWRFDYYYSSPTLYENKLIIGGDDGYLYMLNQVDGKQGWKFKTKGIVRGTAAVFENMVVVGDMDGILYALDIKNGNQKWSFKTVGDSLTNENFGFDRKAILSSPVISQNKILFGCRDGFLYCIDTDGKFLWKMDHRVSWVISTVAVRDSFVVTGTSDGRFVQAVNLNTGRQMWRTPTNTLHWSSPTIVNDKVYIGGFDGNEYCLDLLNGNLISKFQTGGMILSSAVFDNDRLYVGSDDGCLYSLSGHKDNRIKSDRLKRYVFYEPGINIYFRNNSDLKIKNYLANCGYKVLNKDSLIALLSGQIDQYTVIVFASDYFPKTVTQNASNSLLRKFLDAGGRVVLTGINPLVYIIDEEGKQPIGFNVPAADSVLGIKYGENDTRSFGGQFSCFATGKGKQFGLPDFWMSNLQINADQVDVVFGKNENGFVSAYAKNYKNGGKFIQAWMNQDAPDHLDAILKLSEWKID